MIGLAVDYAKHAAGLDQNMSLAVSSALGVSERTLLRVAREALASVGWPTAMVTASRVITSILSTEYPLSTSCIGLGLLLSLISFKSANLCVRFL